MPYVEPTTRATGHLVTAADWNQDVVANISFLANPPACRVYHNAAQAVNDNAAGQLAFNSERYDTDTMHDPATNNTRITIKTAGLYLVGANVEFAGGTDYLNAYAALRVNGSTLIVLAAAGPMNDASVGIALNPNTIYKFALNDYVEVRVYQNNSGGAARNVLADTQFSPEFWATWIGTG